VRGATSDTGSIIQNLDYLPYGPPAPQQPAVTDTDYGFTGHLKCPFTGLTLAPYRVLGYANWLSRDPIGEAGGINLYNYVSGNPTNLRDPTGENPVILLSIGIYFATEAYARAPEPGYSGPQGLPFNPLSLTGPLAATGAIGASRTICPSAAKTVGTELALSPWPANRGFIAGTIERKFLMPGETFDRYGFGGGKFVSPTGTPLEMRSLRPGTESLPNNSYRVVKPFEVKSGGVAPAFNQRGLGTQHELPVSINTLMKRGIIEKVQ
jgi:RHS repeat-associated protein